MLTALNVKVGSKVTVTLPVDQDGVQATQEFDGEILEFPKTARVRLKDGREVVVNLNQIVAEDVKAAQRFPGRFPARF